MATGDPVYVGGRVGKGEREPCRQTAPDSLVAENKGRWGVERKRKPHRPADGDTPLPK